MNNLLSFCGLVDARVRISEKNLPVMKDDEKNDHKDMTTTDYAALFKTQGETADNFWKHMELSTDAELNCKNILSTLLEKQTKLGFKPIVKFKKETNDDEIEVQRGMKIIEELRTIFQATKGQLISE